MTGFDQIIINAVGQLQFQLQLRTANHGFDLKMQLSDYVSNGILGKCSCLTTILMGKNVVIQPQFQQDSQEHLGLLVVLMEFAGIVVGQLWFGPNI